MSITNKKDINIAVLTVVTEFQTSIRCEEKCRFFFFLMIFDTSNHRSVVDAALLAQSVCACVDNHIDKVPIL